MKSENAFEIIKKEINSYYNELASNIDLILQLTKESEKKSISQIEDFFKIYCSNYLTKKKEIYKKYKIDNNQWFNFFESISDKWYRENFHSDILYTILNPNTPQIGNKCFVEEFVKFLDIEDKFDCSSDFIVTKEEPTGYIVWARNKKGKKQQKKGSIDILIKNEKQAVIIENKINYAPDMENQLVRYMKYVSKKLGIKTYTVVYLTLTDDKNKKPPLISSYDAGFEEYAEMLDKDKGILKEVYAVDINQSLSKDFLPNCCNRLKKELTNNKNEDNNYDVAQVYIDQYRILLNHLGGNAYMSEVDKNLIKKIYSSKENIETALDFINIWENKDFSNCRNSDRKFIETIEADTKKEQAANTFIELWNRRKSVIYSTLNDSINDTINNPDFQSFIEGDFSGIRKDFGDLYICFYIQGLETDCGFGFWRKESSTKKLFEAKRDELEKRIKKVKYINGFKSDIYSKKEDHDWICKQLDLDEIERNKVTLPYLVKEIIGALSILDEEYSKLVEK